MTFPLSISELGTLFKWLGSIATKALNRMSENSRRRHSIQEQHDLIRVQQPIYADLLERFGHFVRGDGGGGCEGIISILNHAYSYNKDNKDIDVIRCIIEEPYIGVWLDCLKKRAVRPASNTDSFVDRCEEFTIIIREFNRNYVLRSQNKMECGLRIQESFVDRLEQFRDRFNPFLLEVEKWAKGPVSGLSTISLVDSFELVKTFRRSSGKTIAEL